MNDRTPHGDAAPSDEPELTQTNTRTIRGEKEISEEEEDTSFEDSNIEQLDDEPSTRNE